MNEIIFKKIEDKTANRSFLDRLNIFRDEVNSLLTNFDYDLVVQFY